MVNSKSNNSRLLSLDALRGFDMFWIMGGELIVQGFALATGWHWADSLAAQTKHAAWNGFTFYDLIFPLFIFIAGVSMPFSIWKRKESGDNLKNVYKHLVIRTLILIGLGILYNRAHWLMEDYIRFASVLARIGLSTFFAALIVLNFSKKWQYIWFGIILLSYWLIMAWWGDYSREGSLNSWIDLHFMPGNITLEKGYLDPEGLLSTFPSIATALLGVICGHFLRDERTNFTPLKKGITLFIASLVLLFLGWLWDFIFPINKKLWTSSFVLFAGGWSVLLMSVFYLIIDVWKYTKWTFFFTVIGVNSIAAYLFPSFFAIKHIQSFIFNGANQFLLENWQPFFYGITYTLLCWLILYVMNKNKIYIKI